MTKDKLATLIRTGENLSCALYHVSDYGHCLDVLLKIRRLAKKHHRLCENACNYAPLEGTTWEELLDALEEKAVKLLKKTPFVLDFQRDPRGLTVRLYAHTGSVIDTPMRTLDLTPLFQF